MIIATTAPDMTGTYLNYLWFSMAAIVVLCLLLWLGWRSRKRRQGHVPAPQEVPAQLLEAEPQVGAEGMVIGTVKDNNYLDRVAVHQLGLRTEGRIEVHLNPAHAEPVATADPATAEGVAIFRAGTRNWFIPLHQLTYVGTDRGMVGKFVEADGIIVIGWELGGTEVATGFRPRHADQGRALLQTLGSRVQQDPPAQTDPASAESPNC